MILRPQLPATPSLACLLNSQSVSLTGYNSTTRPHPTYLTPLPLSSHFKPQQQFRRRFTSSPCSHEPSKKSHYDILGVAPDASKAELKKQFYSLSKSTHPDVNRNNPDAGERFAEISEAYTILGNDEKRRKYDREVLPSFTRTPSRSSSNRSSTYAGSRPATGLSKRRGTFRGPPPSFYSQGAGAGSANPSAEEQAQRDQEAWNRGAQAGQFDPSQYAGAWDPTFDSTPVYKTQTAEDARRQNRRAAEFAAAQAFAEEDGQFWAKFFVVSAIVGVSVVIGSMVHRMSGIPRGGLTKADGTRRTMNGEMAGSK